MPEDSNKLRAELRAAGLSDRAIDAAWPSWWSDEAEHSASAAAELRFTLSRRLGLSARLLVGERVEFVWGDSDARFKRLLYDGGAERAALTSFAMVIGRLLIRACPDHVDMEAIAALRLRRAILARSRFVDLGTLLAACWSVGIPVVQLRVFPLDAKGMDAMVVRVDDRYAVLVARESSYPATTAFTLAHELGHIFLGHMADATVLVDAEEEQQDHGDAEELASDRYALTLLTGSDKPNIKIDRPRFNAVQLARAVTGVADEHRVEPGTLALCVGYARNAWPVATAALRFIYGPPVNVAMGINQIAEGELLWDELGEDAAAYLRRVVGLGE